MNKQNYLVRALTGLLFLTMQDTVQAGTETHSSNNSCLTAPISKIDIKGLKRIEKSTVMQYLAMQKGQICTASMINKTVKNLFHSDFFEQAIVSCCRGDVVVQVFERPVIAHISFSGNDIVKSEDFQKTLKDLGFFEGWNYNPATLKIVEGALLQQYRSRGYYRAKVSHTIELKQKDQVSIHFQIEEGDVARIKKFILLGNHAFSKSKLIDKFQLSESSWLSRITGSDKYSQSTLAGDLERLNNFYQDQGYAQFKILSQQVALSPNLTDVFIVINMNEGAVYRFGQIELKGVIPLSKKITNNLLTSIKTQETYSRTKIATLIDALESALGDQSYAFAQVVPQFHFNQQKRLVDLTLNINPGQQYSVGNIIISGNKSSEDQVVRRELTQMEGAPYSTKKIKQSKQNLQRKTYFKNVAIETQKKPDANRQVDLNVKVEEVPSGHYGVSFGYAQVDGFLLSLHVLEDNFLGTGKQVGFEFNRSKYNQVYQIQYNNPYLTADNLGLGGSIFYSKTNLAQANISDYSLDKIGLSTQVSIPLSSNNRIIPGLTLAKIKLKTNPDPRYISSQVQAFTNQFGKHFSELSPNVTYIHDSRDRTYFAQSGQLFQTMVSSAAPGSTANYYKVEVIEQFYQKISKNWILKLKENVGYGNGLSRGHGLPIYANFFAGGINSVRGYEDNTLGPKDSLNNSFGGNVLVTTSTELSFPFPGIDIEGLRGVMFVDGGNVYAINDKVNYLAPAGPLRWASGVGIEWYAAFGAAISVSLGYPLNDQKGDDTQMFQFSLGGDF